LKPRNFPNSLLTFRVSAA